MPTQSEIPTAIITGASSGIGRGIAIGMAKAGKYKLCLVSRNVSRMEETKQLCLEQNKNTEILITQCDFNDINKLKDCFHRICTSYGPIHVLINNAGIPGTGQVNGADMGITERTFNVNLKSAVLGTQICIPFIIESAKQRKASCAVIQIGSVLGTDFGVGLLAKAMTVPVYGATKHGMRIFNECLFEEVKAYGIKCCCIMPGFVNTPFMKPLEGQLKLEDALSVEDVSQSVQYVLSVSDKACPTDIVIRSQHSLL